jgi:inhibitor of KinA sporulation pathway (predicted exonuclease)
MRQEVIEIGLCVLDPSKKEVVHRQNILVRPVNSEISEFCTEITGLTAETFFGNEAVPFRVAHDMVKNLVAKYEANVMASWGNNDRSYMSSDCEFNGVDYPFPKENLNVQKAFRKAMKLPHDMKVVKAVEHIGLEFEGKQHSAGDDAYNTAIILSHII